MNMSTEVAKERSVRSTPLVYAPSFVISHGNTYQNQTFCIPSDGSYHVRSVPEMRGMRCDGSRYGWLILQSYFSDECHLFNPVTLEKIQLPPLPHDTFDRGFLTYPPSDPKCVIMFFSEEENLCIFCRVGDEKWIEKTVRSQNCDIPVETYLSAVSSKGKIYLFFLHGMAVIDVQDNFAACIELYNIKDPQPTCTKTQRFVLESNGDIFQVCQMYLGVTNIVQKFVVLKLDLSKMAWVEMDSLGDTIFLLGSCSSSEALSAADFGAKGNCLYFFADGRTDLYRFDMEDGTIEITRPCPTKFPKWEVPFWVVPNCKVQVKKQVTEATKEIQVTNSNLPPELLEMIFESLPFGGCIRFRLACRAFMSLTCPVRSFPVQTLPDCQNLPCLISLPPNIEKEICYFYHPIYTDVYTMNIPQLAGAIVRHAKFGWLLM
ncbi:hypothetical protein ACHQM5_011488 [Ranunculus cassubicifolius]